MRVWREITPETSVDRSSLRRSLIATRHALDEADYQARSERITTHLERVLQPLMPAILAFYWPHRREYDPRPIVERVVARGGSAALPVVIEKDRALAFRPWHPDIEMMVGLYEIPHPIGDAAIVPDIVLVPTVGFDRAGYRLGYGGGYYDRTIAAFVKRPLTIGVGFEFGRLDTIDPLAHDIPMDMIATEAGVLTPRSIQGVSKASPRDDHP